GGTQSLHTNSFDEAIALPTEFSSRIARNTQLILQNETGITNVVDPLAGSYYVEKLTADLADKAWALIEEVEEMGGMTKAVATGMPKLRIEEAAARKQAAIDRGEEVIVGVNKFKPTKEDEFEILSIDNEKVRDAQIARLKRTRRNRNEEACQKALDNLEQIARSGDGNIQAGAIEAARARASVGEISQAMETAWGRHVADTQTVSGVYGSAYDDDKRFSEVSEKLVSLGKEAGRAPRILIVKMGQDGHDRGAKVIASAFADLGFEVIVGPLFQTPDEAAKLAVAEDADIVGISSHAAGHLTLAPLLVEELAANDAADKLVICGGVIPSQDYDTLRKAGIAAIYGPGSNILDSADDLLALLFERLRGRNR
ncbi:MAG: methylmalonyl-CoA mutase family protein, partial [Pseudomonadota bacterium]